MSRITRRTIIPVNQITPLTYRDGVTYIQLLTELSEYIKTILHPSLQHTVDQLVADVEHQMDKHHDQYVDGVQEFQRIHDAFMSDVNAKLIALNDGAVADLVKDETSLLGTVLRDIFTDTQKFYDLQSELEYRVNRATSDVEESLAGLDDSISDIENSVSTHMDALSTQLDTGLHNFSEEMERSYVKISNRHLTNILASGSGLIVMLGSSTTTRGGFAKYFASHMRNHFPGGVFTTLQKYRTNARDRVGHLGVDVVYDSVGSDTGGGNSETYIPPATARLVNSLNPTMVFHGVGSNDWRWSNMKPSDYARNMRSALSTITSSKTLHHVILHQHERLTLGGAKVDYKWNDYRDALYNEFSGDDDVSIIDISEDFRALGVGLNMTDPHNLMADDSHTNDNGSALIASIVSRELGFTGGIGVFDSGWHVLDNSNGHIVNWIGENAPGKRMPVQYRIVSDAGGHSMFIRGLIVRNRTTGSGLWTFASYYQNLFNLGDTNPDMNFGEGGRVVIGSWSGSLDRDRGLIDLDSAGTVRIHDPENRLGGQAFTVDLLIRS